MKRNILIISAFTIVLSIIAYNQSFQDNQEQMVIDSTEPIEKEVLVEEIEELNPLHEQYQAEKEIRTTSAIQELSELSIQIPNDVIEYCEQAGDTYGISPEFLEAVCWVESRCEPNATNGSCKGIMQISEQWHSDRMNKLGVTSIYDTKGNIMVGADYLAELFESYEDGALVLAVYNGDSTAFKLNENGEMSNYAEEILNIAYLLETANGK